MFDKRLKALEVVFNGGQGDNFIYDALMSKLADEVRNNLISSDEKTFSLQPDLVLFRNRPESPTTLPSANSSKRIQIR